MQKDSLQMYQYGQNLQESLLPHHRGSSGQAAHLVCLQKEEK